MCKTFFKCPSSPAGVLQSGDPVQAGGAAGRPDQEEHLSVPGRLQRVPGQAGLQEEEGELQHSIMFIIGTSFLLQFSLLSRHA